MDATVTESGKTMSVILDKEDETASVKQIGAESWVENPMMFSQMWGQFREDISNYGSAEDWHKWEEKGEHILEDEDGEDSVRAWDIEVNEQIEDSVFNP